MKMDNITGLALGVTLAVGLGAGYGMRALSSPQAVDTASTTLPERTIPNPADDPRVADLQSRLDQVEGELAETRCALGSSGGINAYHEGDYPLAIELYDEALKCGSQDGYVLSLKAYSLFKSGAVEEAIAAQRSSLEDQPEYALGYFNLARFLCAAGDFEGAAAEVATAVSLWPDVEGIAEEDGEYQKLCQGGVMP